MSHDLHASLTALGNLALDLAAELAVAGPLPDAQALAAARQADALRARLEALAERVSRAVNPVPLVVA